MSSHKDHVKFHRAYVHSRDDDRSVYKSILHTIQFMSMCSIDGLDYEYRKIERECIESKVSKKKYEDVRFPFIIIMLFILSAIEIGSTC